MPSNLLREKKIL